MYTLKVLKSFHSIEKKRIGNDVYEETERIFIEGDKSTGLTASEVKALVTEYPKNFEAGDEITRLLIESFQA